MLQIISSASTWTIFWACLERVSRKKCDNLLFRGKRKGPPLFPLPTLEMSSDNTSKIYLCGKISKRYQLHLSLEHYKRILELRFSKLRHKKTLFAPLWKQLFVGISGIRLSPMDLQWLPWQIWPLGLYWLALRPIEVEMWKSGRGEQGGNRKANSIVGVFRHAKQQNNSNKKTSTEIQTWCLF